MFNGELIFYKKRHRKVGVVFYYKWKTWYQVQG